MTKVLVVDDEPSNVEVATVICQALGFETYTAVNGQQALDLLATTHVDLVLMDVLMPVLDGIAATRLIRLDPRLSMLPILGVTARASTADRVEMLEAGMNDVLLKPYRNKNLVEAMRKIMAPSDGAQMV
jgi:CheY-like chemotaxis protein